MNAAVSGRLVRAGTDASGAAAVLGDNVVDEAVLAGGAFSARFYGGRDAIAHYPASEAPSAAGGWPPAGGWRCATLTLARDSDAAYHGFIRDALGAFADPAEPGFHKTPTTDIILVLAGSFALDLDRGETRRLERGDMAVLDGVRHRWRNVGDGPAMLMSVQLGAAHDDPSPDCPSTRGADR